MDLTHSLDDASYKEAVDVLMDRFEQIQRQPPRFPWEKQAASDWLSSLGETVGGDPVARNALLGAGAGAAVGAGTHLMGSDPERRKRGLMSHVIQGGTAGAALGGGLGLAQKGFGGGKSAPVVPKGAGVYTDPATGQRMQIDPKALKAHPELLKKIQQLSDPGSYVDQSIYGTASAIASTVYNRFPVSASVLGGLGVRDLYYNTKWAPKAVGTTIGAAGGSLRGLGLESAGKKVQGFGKYMGRAGVIDKTMSTDPQHLQKGLTAMMDDPKTNTHLSHEKQFMKKLLARKDAPEILAALKSGDTSKLTPAQQRMFHEGGLRGRVLPDKNPAMEKLHKEMQGVHKNLGKLKPGSQQHTELTTLLNELRATRSAMNKKVPVRLSKELLQQATGMGVDKHVAENPAEFTGVKPVTSIGPGGKTRVTPSVWSRGRLAPRLGVMAAAPTLEYFGRGYLEESGKEKAIREHMRRLAKPVE